MKAVLVAVMGLVVATLAAQEVTKPEVAGVRNFARLETTVACAGATGPEAMPEIKKMGFVSVINLRVATEQGAEIEKGEAAAKAAGLRYFHVPFDGKPNPQAARAVPRRDHDQGRRTGLHSLRRRQPRGDDVADQTPGGRQVGRRPRGQGGGGARPDQSRRAEVGDRVRPSQPALTSGQRLANS